MASPRIAPESAEERLVFWALAGAWGFYVLGSLYLVGPGLAVSLMAILGWRAFAAPWRPLAERPLPLPAGVAIWIVGMLVMLVALLVVHLTERLGFGQTLKSSIGWLKGWALLAFFPCAGACLRIRPQIVIRAANWFAVQTLALMPVLIGAGLAHAPGKLYVSPLEAVGGPGPEFFTVYLYIVDPSNGALRWEFIAPWAPAAGLLGNMLFVLASYERDLRFRIAGSICGVMMAVMTGSRMALLFFVIYPPLIWSLSRLSRPWLLIGATAISSLGGVIVGPIINMVQDAVQAFRSARADSTRVREALGRIAVERWWADAPVWGHGVVLRGTHFVEHMPIGSHHSWFGLLYVKGAVGLFALLVPLVWTLLEMILLAQVTRIGRLGLTMTVLITFYSFGENLEILAYLIWPGLLLIGCAFRRTVAAPSRLPDTATQPGEAVV